MEISPADVEAVLASADNLNAALKTFLKKEGKAGRSVETFAKNLRAVVARNRGAALREYIDTHYEDKRVHFALLAAYAHPNVRDAIVPAVFDKHAEAFNATYEKGNDGVVVTDSAKFQEVAKDVVAMISSALKEANLPSNNFFVYSLLISIFEPDVLHEVMEILT
jgi:hypothetical protein